MGVDVSKITTQTDKLKAHIGKNYYIYTNGCPKLVHRFYNVMSSKKIDFLCLQTFYSNLGQLEMAYWKFFMKSP